VYTFYNPGSGRENNETLLTGTTAGSFPGYHNGDATLQNKGICTIAGTTGTGTIAYACTGGKTYTYNVCLTPSGDVYQFLNTSAAMLISIVVTTSPTGRTC
jgi:hypothetical protein